MPSGTCICGEIKIPYAGAPAFTVRLCTCRGGIQRIPLTCDAQALCHCDDDRRMSNLQTFQVPKRNFSLDQGTPKVYTEVSDFGRVGPSLSRASLPAYCSDDQEIDLHFCPTCGTALYRTRGSPNVRDMIGIRAGVMVDDPLLEETPKIEVYVEKRPGWRGRVEGVVQLSGRYEVVEEGGE